jgi:hypothetical protein
MYRGRVGRRTRADGSRRDSGPDSGTSLNREALGEGNAHRTWQMGFNFDSRAHSLAHPAYPLQGNRRCPGTLPPSPRLGLNTRGPRLGAKRCLFALGVLLFVVVFFSVGNSSRRRSLSDFPKVVFPKLREDSPPNLDPSVCLSPGCCGYSRP